MVPTKKSFDEYEIFELEKLLKAHRVSEERSQQLRRYFRWLPWDPKSKTWIQRAQFTDDDVCMVTRWDFIDAVNWMATCDAMDRRAGGRRR